MRWAEVDDLELLFQELVGNDWEDKKRRWTEMPVECSRLFVHRFNSYMEFFVLSD